jgi:hypothetical protein
LLFVGGVVAAGGFAGWASGASAPGLLVSTFASFEREHPATRTQQTAHACQPARD